MSSRFITFLALSFFIILPTPSRAADAKEAPSGPTLVVQVRPIEGLLADLRFLAGLAGKEEEGGQIEGLVKSRKGAKGIAGIDDKRPWGMYATVSPDVMGSTVVVLLPIAGEKEFLDTIENFTQKAKKDADGIYTQADFLPVALHFRFANKYVYITGIDKASLGQNKLLDPTQVLPASETSMMSATFNIDRIDGELKNIALSQLDLKIDEAKKRKPAGQTDAQHQVQVKVLDEIGRQIATVVNDGSQMRLQLDVDRTAGVLSSEFRLAGKPKSKLAAHIAELGQGKSLAAGIVGGDAAIQLIEHVVLPAEVRAVLKPAIDEIFKAALDKEKDEKKRAVAEQFLNALRPTLAAGTFDLGFAFRGPLEDKHYSFTGVLSLQEGQALDKALHSLVEELSKREQALFELDVDKEGATSIHRINAHKSRKFKFDEKARNTLGDNPLYLAFRADRALLTGGPDGLKIIKEAMSAQPKAAPVFHFEMSLARLAPVLVKNAEQQKKIVAIADKVFGKKGNDRLRIDVEGGKALKASFYLDAPVLQFITLAEQSKGDKQEKDREEK